MGVMPRKLGENFVITSDRIPGEVSKDRTPKRRPEGYQVWTGNGWSANLTDATTFPAMDGVEEYIRANYARVMQ